MEKSDVDARFRVILTIWGALLVGVTLVTALAWALTTGRLGAWTPIMEAGVARNLLSAPVLLMAAGIFFRRGVIDRGEGDEAYLRAYQSRALLAAAMQDGGGMLGLALCLLAGMPTGALAVWVLTVLAMGMSWPRRSDLDHLGR